METAGEMIIAAKQLYAAFLRRDFASVLAALAEDVVWAEPTNPFNPSGGVRHGHAGLPPGKLSVLEIRRACLRDELLLIQDNGVALYRPLRVVCRSVPGRNYSRAAHSETRGQKPFEEPLPSLHHPCNLRSDRQ